MKRTIRFLLRGCYLFFEIFVFLILALVIYLGVVIPIPYPEIDDLSVLELEREIIGIDHYRIGNNWAKKNDHDIWEVYIEGSPFDRGLIYGKLLKEPVQQQEVFFINQLEKIIPNATYRLLLTVIIGYFNRDMTEYIPEEYLQEIYGVSYSFADQYDELAPKYYRILNYHAAHDIGHALEEYNMVGCTSFSVKNEFSKDSALAVGRNFDFYVGDEFSEEKVLSFINPNKGHQFAMYSWAGLMGVVSGMNETGLSVTINASKSGLPTKTKTPISIVTREILQYASTTKEAIEIAKKREVFVSETIMVTSAEDNKTILIEKSPEGIDVYESSNGKVLCTNHYQSKLFKDEEINVTNIKNSDSKYRFDRMNELITQKQPLDVKEVISILRDQKGIDGASLGFGNPKAINQLIAHHSIVFRPQERKMWISTNPYQLGEFICYDLNTVFNRTKAPRLLEKIYIDSLTISSDPFLVSNAYKNFEYFKSIKKKMFDQFMIGIPFELSDTERDKFIAANPDSYVTYMTIGQYYMDLENFNLAQNYFKKALTKEIASIDEEEKIKSLIDECNN